MALEYDPAKDDANQEKHLLSLSRALEVTLVAVVPDDRKDYGEPRFRGFGYLDGMAVSLVFTLRDDSIRAISLRRAHRKEMKRYEP